MNEFSVKPKHRYLLIHELKRIARPILNRFRGRIGREPLLNWRFSPTQGKWLVLKNRLAYTETGLSWFYTAFERDYDPLTSRAMSWISKNVPKDQKILMTGCGTGLMAFHLADDGFSRIQGRDLLEPCISIANQIKERWNYTNTEFIKDDGFSPRFAPDEKFVLITAMHWVFSAWMGNYGNIKKPDLNTETTRKRLLDEFLGLYSPVLAPGGHLIIELIDAVADYRDPFDHPLGNKSTEIYPVRHTPSMVEECAKSHGMIVVEKWLGVSYGHQPRTAYYLKKA